MFPGLSKNYSTNTRLGNSKFLTQFPLIKFLRGICSSYFYHIYFGHLRKVAFLAIFGLRCPRMTIFRPHVGDIFQMRSQKQMRRINARPNIASMKDMQIVLNGPPEKGPRKAMGIVLSSFFTPRAICNSISLGSRSICPQPTPPVRVKFNTRHQIFNRVRMRFSHSDLVRRLMVRGVERSNAHLPLFMAHVVAERY
jgi:hypothetical protein